ncbi:extracellular solute-binding protein [Phytohabitans suffuscus]|uniref:ABC transporter substrate-binding protein n=1 Tax=Phytohabitans suffuscus TaxID=624315 RepID=A0A6F8Z154_9ACTN|nr:extracellular solute-binding protein [Phytohabitans suffuscus]BCB92056.1 hypothetical protein Psuf_093690 [Phytohabitans suffuscus]
MTTPTTARTRRHHIVSAVSTAALLLALAACGGDGDAGADQASSCALPSGAVTAENNCKFDGETITVSVTPGGLADGARAGLGQLFESTTGAKIEWVEQGPDEILTQLLAARGGTPPVDVVLDMYVPTLYNAARDEVFAKVDRSRIPNVGDVTPSAYAVPDLGPAGYVWVVGACVNESRLGELGVAGLNRFEDWFDPRLGAVAFPQPTNSRWNLTMSALAAHYGAPLDNPSIVIDQLKKLPGLKLYGATSEADDMVQSGEVSAAISSDGRCNGLAKSGAPVRFAPLNLSAGSATYTYIQAATGPQIVAGTKKTAMAEALINTLFSPDGKAMLPLTTKLIYSPTKPSIATAMKQDPAVAQYVLTDFTTLYSDPDFVAQFMRQRQVWVDAWNRAFH